MRSPPAAAVTQARRAQRGILERLLDEAAGGGGGLASAMESRRLRGARARRRQRRQATPRAAAYPSPPPSPPPMATAMASSALRNSARSCARRRASKAGRSARRRCAGLTVRRRRVGDGNGARVPARRAPRMLSATHRRVLDLLRAGTATPAGRCRGEFRQAVAALGFVAPATWTQSSTRWTRTGRGSSHSPSSPRASAPRPSRNKHALRRGKLGPNARKSALGSDVTVSATATESVQQQLQRILPAAAR